MSPTATGLLRSERRRVTSSRTWWAFGLPPILIGGFASAVYSGIAGSDAFVGVDGADRIASLVGLYVTVAMSVLFSALFGAVNSATELRHTTAASTFLASPHRGPVVAATILVSAVVGTLYAVASLAVSVTALAVFGGAAIDDGLVLAVCLLGVVASASWAVLGCGLGLLTASPVLAAAILVGWLPVGELIVVTVLDGIGANAIAVLLPGSTTVALLSADVGRASDALLPFPAAAFALLLWTSGVAGAGWWRTARRDLT